MLESIPTDIALEITRHLGLRDAVSMTMTCTPLRSLTCQRNFWILILSAARILAPLDCPPLSDLATFTLAELKSLALSKLKLEANWSTEQPQLSLTRPLKTGDLLESSRILCGVQGTDILLLYGMFSDILYCWDKREACFFAEVGPISLGGEIKSIVVPNYSDGVSCDSFIFITRDREGPRTHSQSIITIRHKDGKALMLEHKSTEISDDGFIGDPTGLFPVSNATTCCIFEDAFDTEASWLSVAEREGNPSSSSIRYRQVAQLYDVDGSAGEPHARSFSYHGHGFILLLCGVMSLEILHLPRTTLKRGKHKWLRYYKLDDFQIPITVPSTSCWCLPSSPRYGISGVYIRGTKAAVSVLFVPCLPVQDDTAEDSLAPPLDFSSTHLTHIAIPVDTSVDNELPGPFCVDHSGRNVLGVIQQDNSHKLMLARYHPPEKPDSPGSVTVHWPQSPEKLDLQGVHSCYVDDASGTVHLIDRIEVFHTLSYV
ncbi:hypothetical protein MIND_01388900 [Mycena indigotica]|uniref:F-box domain-containing protein n=1 Tax=Mycena indigotica TaxID=2126181 RepID=A0A8H6RYI4_9AGAR|nr:uncharacterized protein MIND_01388900 [Mycena indigotica]KAF7289273.1 hypothetical protein MIND_01388900 [Mycena indigotica]